MTNNFLKIWAILVTAIALVLLGVLIGRSANSGPDTVALRTADTSAYVSDATNPNAMEPRPDPYTIPETLKQLPTEWRSVADGVFNGYAILFDPARREVIIEQCLHHGYFDIDKGEPQKEGLEFCENVLWGTLIAITEHSAVATDQRGNFVDLNLALGKSDGERQLKLSFNDHDMELVPGSKNDLFQTMDKTPKMEKQKQMRFEYLEVEYQKQLKARQQSNGVIPAEVPRYTLPQRQKVATEEQALTDND